jgi:malate/lactate dehydrogenase
MRRVRTKTRGHVALAKWIAKDPEVRTRTYIAELAGVTAAAVSQWMTLHSVPDLKALLSLKHMAGIELSDWLSQEQRGHVEGVLERVRKHAA